MSGKAIPRPWRIVLRLDPLDCEHVVSISVSDSYGDEVARFHPSKKAVARMIVSAVNAHDDLLAAAKACHVWVVLATGRDPNVTHPKAIKNAMDDLAELEAAIAKAETDRSGTWPHNRAN